MIMSRIYSILGIATMTGIMCFQDMTKKGIVVKNFSGTLINQVPSPVEKVKDKVD